MTLPRLALEGAGGGRVVVGGGRSEEDGTRREAAEDGPSGRSDLGPGMIDGGGIWIVSGFFPPFL